MRERRRKSADREIADLSAAEADPGSSGAGRPILKKAG
jgi:hypothetical protein